MGTHFKKKEFNKDVGQLKVRNDKATLAEKNQKEAKGRFVGCGTHLLFLFLFFRFRLLLFNTFDLLRRIFGSLGENKLQGLRKKTRLSFMAKLCA